MVEVKNINGPWSVRLDLREERGEEFLAGYGIVDVEGREVVGCEGIVPGPGAEARAALAAAAPDLLEALRVIAHIVHQCLGRQDEKLADILPIARAALSKASPNLPSASQEGGE